jgi:hypothetical protein
VLKTAESANRRICAMSYIMSYKITLIGWGGNEILLSGIHPKDGNANPKMIPRTWSDAINPMPCLLLILVLAFPRIVLVLLFLFSTYLERAYHGLLLPILGFLFLPVTTLAYAWMANTGQPTAGVNLLILIIAVIIDLGGLGGGEYHRRSR